MGTFTLSDESIKSEKPSKGLESFVQEFFEDRVLEVQAAHDSLDRNDFDHVRKLGHSWKGYSEPYGFQTLGLLAEELEVVAHHEQAEESKKLLNQIDQYLEMKSKYIKLN